MTSQVLAIFYLNELDHFIKEKLKVKCYIRYQDDGCIYHESKEYLKYCLNEITRFLQNEKLTLNIKTRIFKSSDNFIFLGRNSKGKYAKYRLLNKRINKKYQEYNNKKIEINNLVCSIKSYKQVSKNAKSALRGEIIYGKRTR